MERCFTVLKENQRLVTRSEKTQEIPEHAKTGGNHVVFEVIVKPGDTA
ncbi:hypothetical protein GIX45_05040 [Erwinia sp. CPCC 100877]|nr:hypothetical protein [Erwinia sp. CPCC 100877]